MVGGDGRRVTRCVGFTGFTTGMLLPTVTASGMSLERWLGGGTLTITGPAFAGGAIAGAMARTAA
ncbi:hypothetical protein GCM10022270_30790 [Terriglobus aquaticus]